MGNKIIVCGGNGAGKTTLGKALSDQLGYKFLDIEDYYFDKSNLDYIYNNPKTYEEVQKLLLDDFNKFDNFIFAAVKGNYCNEISNLFTHAVYISVKKEIRIKRVMERSYNKFGDRVLYGGDLYYKEKSFIDMVNNRSDNYTLDWLKTVNIPIVKVDGTKPIDKNILIIQKELLLK